jgi:hypothetical protein
MVGRNWNRSNTRTILQPHRGDSGTSLLLGLATPVASRNMGRLAVAGTFHFAVFLEQLLLSFVPET